MAIGYLKHNMPHWVPFLKGLTLTRDTGGLLPLAVGLSALLSSVSAFIPAVFASNMKSLQGGYRITCPAPAEKKPAANRPSSRSRASAPPSEAQDSRRRGFSVDPSSIVAITGRSGAGKTTLLGIISGLMKPDSGKVVYRGQNILKWGDFRRSRFRNREIGFVFQFFNLLPDMTSYRTSSTPR